MSRKYKLNKRADRQAETRRRIVQAALELHGTVGPARTTVSAIAELAGVERKTFYRHFPELEQIFAACGAHFRELNPPPNPDTWNAIADPGKRLNDALKAYYGYYRQHQQTIANILRDRELGVPVGDGLINHRATAKRALKNAFTVSHRRQPILDASLDLALDFHTWQTLANAGITDPQAAKLLSALVLAQNRHRPKTRPPRNPQVDAHRKQSPVRALSVDPLLCGE